MKHKRSLIDNDLIQCLLDANCKAKDLLESFDAGIKALNSNLKKSDIEFSYYIKDKYGYSRGNSSLNNWREQHSSVLTEAVAHLDNNTANEPVMALRGIYTDRTHFKTMLEECQGSPETKRAIFVEAIFTGSLWNKSSHPQSIVRGQILEMIGSDPFLGEYEFNCPHCGLGAKTTYDSRFRSKNTTCGTCNHEIRFELIELNPVETLEERLAAHTDKVVQIENIELAHWNSVKKECEELVATIINASQSQASPRVAQKLKLRTVNLSSLPFDVLLPNETHREPFLNHRDIAESVYHSVVGVINEISKSSGVIPIESVDSLDPKRYLSRFFDSNRRGSYAPDKAFINSITAQISRQVLDNCGIVKVVSIPVESSVWSHINKFITLSPCANTEGFLNFRMKYGNSRNHKISYVVIDVEALKNIQFIVNEGELVNAIEPSQIKDRTKRELVQKSKDDWESKCRKLIVVYTSKASVGFVNMQMTLRKHGIQNYRTIKLDGFRLLGLYSVAEQLKINKGDVILIGRGSGDIQHESFSAFTFPDAISAIEIMKNKGATVVLGVGKRTDRFPIDSVVDFHEDNPINAAKTAAILIKSMN